MCLALIYHFLKATQILISSLKFEVVLQKPEKKPPNETKTYINAINPFEELRSKKAKIFFENKK